MSVQIARLGNDGADEFGLVSRQLREGLGAFGVLDLRVDFSLTDSLLVREVSRMGSF